MFFYSVELSIDFFEIRLDKYVPHLIFLSVNYLLLFRLPFWPFFVLNLHIWLADYNVTLRWFFITPLHVSYKNIYGIIYYLRTWLWGGFYLFLGHFILRILCLGLGLGLSAYQYWILFYAFIFLLRFNLV